MSPSIWQILIVVAIIVLLFGANRIPQLGKSLGEAIRGFKKGISEDEIDVTESSRNEQIKQSSAGEQNKKTEKHKEEQS